MSSKYSKYGSNLAFIDMLFALLIGVFSIFIISTMLLGDPKATHANIVDSAKLAVDLTWDDHSADDMDLWVLEPGGDQIGYSRKENSYISLDHDDRGGQNNYVVINGQRIEIRHHEEVTRIRYLMPGHYVINVQFYNRGTDYETQVTSVGPQQVTVKLFQVNPSFAVLYERTFFVDGPGKQKTAFSFDITPDGKIENFSEDDVPFLKNKAESEEYMGHEHED